MNVIEELEQEEAQRLTASKKIPVFAPVTVNLPTPRLPN